MSKPLISCLCPTRNKPDIVKVAIDCFINQTYENKELILVANEDNPYIEDLKRFTSDSVKLFFVPNNSILGAIRNASVDNAAGEYIAQWDDDNIHHEDRLTLQYDSIVANNKQACFLKRVLIRDTISGTIGVSKIGRGIESTIMALKNKLPKYNNNTRVAEDLPARKYFVESGNCILIDNPQLYTYNIHENNTCQYVHLMDMLA